jgi:hypothetical protein
MRTHDAATHLRWFAAGLVFAFLVPFVGSSVLDLQHDIYLGLYMAAVLLWLGAYVRANSIDVRGVFTRHWMASLGLAAIVSVLLVKNVLSEDATDRPGGAYFVFELLWRGGLYGVVDALLLTAFPCAVVWAAMGGRLETWGRRLGYFIASLALVMTITAGYHLGYDTYRSDGVRAPETGNTIISLPALLTTNPLGSVVSHAAMHISAVAHEYETEVRLPPQTEA